MSAFMYIHDNSKDWENSMSHLIFVVGQVGLKFLLIVDQLEQTLKKMKAEIEKTRNKEEIEEI